MRRAICSCHYNSLFSLVNKGGIRFFLFQSEDIIIRILYLCRLMIPVSLPTPHQPASSHPLYIPYLRSRYSISHIYISFVTQHHQFYKYLKPVKPITQVHSNFRLYEFKCFCLDLYFYVSCEQQCQEQCLIKV